MKNWLSRLKLRRPNREPPEASSSAQEHESGLNDFKSWLHDFAERQLAPYLDALETTAPSSVPREFNDPVWSTISLKAFEAIIVDSPLFQRLRRIRQLGVVHWIYPGATHTRFEHSIGVLHQVQQLIDSINRFPVQTTPPISKKEICFLRLAALCHDIGHGLMSHVSENALESLSQIRQLQLDFQELTKFGERRSLSEIAAYYLVLAPAFSKLVLKAKELAGESNVDSQTVELTSNTLIGHIVSSSSPLIQELISGPFDADKLDYMVRDAFMCGIPAVTDIPRLVRKVRAIWVNEHELPASIQKHVESGHGRYLMIGIDISGSRTLDELLLARILLFDKVYRHQKVRALEGMVTILLQKLLTVYRNPPFQLPYELTDDFLLEGAAALEKTMSFNFVQNDASQTRDVIEDICSRLRDRRLFVRAHVFGLYIEPDPPSGTHTPWRAAMNIFLLDIEKRQRQIIHQIAEKTRDILRRLDRSSIISKMADPKLLSYIWVDLRPAQSHSQKIGNALLIKGHDRLIRYRQQAPEISKWADAYLSRKDIGYVFCAPELKLYVYLAFEMYLRETYRIKTPDDALDYLKHDGAKIQEAEQKLLAGGYYKHLFVSLRPLPERLGRADVESACTSLLERLQGYDPPTSPSEESTKLTRERIIAWLAQFGDQSCIEVAVEVIRKLKIIGRQDVTNSLHAFRSSSATFSRGVVTPLGDPKDSGSMAAYYAGDVEGVSVVALPDALKQAGPIIFIDDFMGRGSTAIDTIECLLGLPRTQDLNQTPRQTLDQKGQEALRSKPIAFVYAAGWSIGDQRVREVCENYGLNVTVHIGLPESSLPRLEDLKGNTNPEEFEKFRRQCDAIGEALVSVSGSGRSKQKLTERHLGYGNKGFLVTFPWNTPTQTLTCIWAKGNYDGCEWLPLLSRRSKR